MPWAVRPVSRLSGTHEVYSYGPEPNRKRQAHTQQRSDPPGAEGEEAVQSGAPGRAFRKDFAERGETELLPLLLLLILRHRLRAKRQPDVFCTHALRRLFRGSLPSKRVHTRKPPRHAIAPAGSLLRRRPPPSRPRGGSIFREQHSTRVRLSCSRYDFVLRLGHAGYVRTSGALHWLRQTELFRNRLFPESRSPGRRDGRGLGDRR